MHIATHHLDGTSTAPSTPNPAEVMDYRDSKLPGIVLRAGPSGLPDEVTRQRLVWHNNGPWKLTELVDEEIPHSFPVPHTDMLRQVINYRVSDAEKVDDLFKYDGSVIVERTKGEIAARYDKEETNFSSAQPRQ